MSTWLFFLFFCMNQKIISTELITSTTNCTIYKDNLAEAVSAFTSCAISYAHPIKFCESCVDAYIEVLDSFKNLFVYKDKNGPCVDSYINLDRLQIITTLYGNSYDLWNRAKCYECFQTINGELTNKPSTETTTFFDLHKNWTDCRDKNDANDTILCSVCMNAYVKLNSYYLSISNENEKIGVCMDIVDAMNGTRAYWSAKCCVFRHKNEAIFLTSTIIVSFTTILFYIFTKLCSKKKTPIILKQTRFAGSFNQVFD
ncbi:hypothetical protein ILUMI_10782 [Ignelater luminosus]|uniref:Osteopetrosis-associated transmembrane protein 1 n=1 Tax=Ignelater luminosus TaxID=2038154 RepID=A0A8K0D396_IGNLU|nr:hypothetical protein ILUMI_10782 [Ignelater luminosus]